MSDEPVTVTLVRSMIDTARAELRGEMTTAVEHIGGRIDVLVEAQNGAAEQAKLSRELSSLEHGNVEARLAGLSLQVTDAVERIAVRERDDQADDAAAEADSRWRRRFWAAVTVAVPVATTFGIFAAERLLS